MHPRRTVLSLMLLVTLCTSISLRPTAGWADDGGQPFQPKQDVLPVAPPEGAHVLFDGGKTLHFVSKQGKQPDWPIEDGTLVSTPSDERSNHIASTLHFRDADIHVEFILPEKGPGNSGVYIHGNYELQIINSHGKVQPTQDDMGAVYGFAPPLVNAARKPGEWQVYDIRYRAPRRNEKGEIIEEGSISAWLNGQKVQENTRIGEPRSTYHPFRYKSTDYLARIWQRQKETMVGPVFLQDHDAPVRFRNVWVRPLDERAQVYDEKPAPDAKPKVKAKPILFQYKSDGIEVPAAKADEPKVAAFGPETILAARKYLDDGANYWMREKKCVACHSTGVYMAERPALTALLGKPSEEVLKQFVESIPEEGVGEPVLRGGVKYFKASIQTVWRSLGLAMWDRHVTGTSSEHTDTALRQTLQCLADEGFIMTFPQVEIPYITTDFELTVQAARAIATAPGWLDSVTDPEALDRIERMKLYLNWHEPINDYERALKLQLASIMPEVVSPTEREASIAMLWRQQLPDGGWSTRRMSDLMKWHVTMDPKVVDMIESEPDAANPGSDPYMTAFAIVLLREAGIPVADPRIQAGIAWLKQNQRVTGRWWMKSLYRDTYHYITYISTAQALRALALCGEVPDLAQ